MCDCTHEEKVNREGFTMDLEGDVMVVLFYEMLSQLVVGNIPFRKAKLFTSNYTNRAVPVVTALLSSIVHIC